MSSKLTVWLLTTAEYMVLQQRSRGGRQSLSHLPTRPRRCILPILPQMQTRRLKQPKHFKKFFNYAHFENFRGKSVVKKQAFLKWLKITIRPTQTYKTSPCGGLNDIGMQIDYKPTITAGQAKKKRKNQTDLTEMLTNSQQCSVGQMLL